MCIVITNVGGNPMGISEYTVQINNQDPITTFKHNRPSGLAECLRKAADAVDHAMWTEAARVF